MAAPAYFPNASSEPVGRFWGILPWLSRAVMLPPVVILTIIMFRYFSNTEGAIAGVRLTTPEAFTDTRVVGAWALCFAIMQVVLLVDRRRLWLGHLQLIFFMGLTLAVRIFGFLHDGTTLAMGNQRMITVVETLFLCLNAAGLAAQRMEWRRQLQT